MPTVRGIKINIISQWELKVHPEFPHPDSTLSVHDHRNPACDDAAIGTHSLEKKISSEFEKAEMLDQPASVSVYTPSVPGAKFWITWMITQSAVELSQWYYFKLYLNGRHVTSWGTDSHKNPKGQVMRGLFEPSDRWNYKSAGIVYKNMGTESRPFIFSQKPDAGSAAMDGGVMEVRVFRALGRRRKMPEPTDFRSQDRYGIAMPSGGLLDKPEDAKFYDWHLSDAVDEPFAITRFHYRSWNSLHDLSLIPEDHPRELHSPSPSIRSILGQVDRSQLLVDSKGLEDIEDHDFNGQEETDDEDIYDNWEDEFEEPDSGQGELRRDSNTSDTSDSPWLTTVFDDDDDGNIMARCERRSSAGMKYEDAPINKDPLKVDLVSRFSTSTSTEPTSLESTKQPRRTKRRSILDRPLPDIPQRSSSIRTSHSRISSNTSVATSVTPSLRSYVDRGDTSSPEPVVNTAQTLTVPKLFVDSGNAKLIDVTPPKMKNETPTQEPSPPLTSPELSPPETAIKDVAPPRRLKHTPPVRVSSAEHNPKPLEKSPLSDLFKSPNSMNIAVRKHRRTPGNFFARLSISSSPFKNGSPFRSNSFSKRGDGENQSQEQATPPSSNSVTNTVSEGKWMGRTPSTQRDQDEARYNNMWSPSLGEDGKHRQRRVTESPVKKSLWRDSPTIDSGNTFSPSSTGDLHTVDKVVGRSHERLATKALEWYETVRAAKENSEDDHAAALHCTNNNDVKTRYGWI